MRKVLCEYQLNVLIREIILTGDLYRIEELRHHWFSKRPQPITYSIVTASCQIVHCWNFIIAILLYTQILLRVLFILFKFFVAPKLHFNSIGNNWNKRYWCEMTYITVRTKLLETSTSPRSCFGFAWVFSSKLLYVQSFFIVCSISVKLGVRPPSPVSFIFGRPVVTL